jgi:two-component system cell cycle sensor histidine kinase/response regulator CckA
MSDEEAAMSEAVMAASPGTREPDRNEAGGFGAGLGILAAGAILILTLLSSGAARPLLLTLMAVLALAGAFFLFAFMAGHIRLGERVREGDLLRLLADGIPEAVLIASGDGTAQYVNRMFEDVVGYNSAGQPRTLDAAFASEPAAASALYRLNRAARRREVRSEEFAFNSSPGLGSKLLRVGCRPLVNETLERELGPLTLWTIADITEERSREQHQIDALQERIRLYERTPAGLIVVAADGHVRQFNQAFAEWVNETANEPSDRMMRLSDLVSQDGAELLRAAARRIGPVSSGLDLDVKTNNGKLVPMRFLVRGTAEGGLLISAFNREADEAANQDDGKIDFRFARFFQSAPFGIATVSTDGRVTSANAAFTRMIMEGSSGVGELALDVLTRSGESPARTEIEIGLKQVLAGRAFASPVEISVGPEKEFTRRVFMSPLTRSGEGREAAILYVIDATEQKALEAKFAQSSKMEAVGKLAGGIAHDFNNVLTAIIGFSDLLLQTHRPADPAYKDINNIRSSAVRAAGLVAKLLAFSRRQTFQTEPLQLGEVLTDLALLLKRSIGEKIELKIPSARDLWYVKADKTQFEQVVINLAVNARDAMPDGGKLTIRTKNVTERDSQKLNDAGLAVGEYVAIEVQDTGSGMSKEVMAKIFEPFFTTKGVGKGTGLGLATVYGIVKQSGGFIFPESEPGKGTTFRVYLPRHVPDSEDEIAALAKGQKKEAQAADLTGTGRVLLVEDEDVVRSFAVRALKRQGYEVLEATTGVEALEVLQKVDWKVDIVVSDVVMPEMDGPTLLKRLRAKNPVIKIIFVSGYPNEAFEESLGSGQQFAFLPKPFSLPQLAAKVKEELGR